MNHDEIMRVLGLFAMFPNDCTDMLTWRTDGEYAPITFMANCSDEFAWACADTETIEPRDLDALERAFADVRAVECPAFWAPVLFAARKRGMRLIKAPSEERLRALFEACGPVRDV
jgi:hypothetical protein